MGAEPFMEASDGGVGHAPSLAGGVGWGLGKCGRQVVAAFTKPLWRFPYPMKWRISKNTWVALLAGAALAAAGGACGRLVVGDDRVAAARKEKGAAVRDLFAAKKLAYPPRTLFLRAFKDERTLEIWAADDPAKPMQWIKSYRIAAMSGDLGPKRREGDRQAPEGFYRIDRFNPKSSYHLSLGLNYPNASDRILSDRDRPGSDIFIHGAEVSIGCLAMTDPMIQEIYVMAWDARQAGLKAIPVHIFPTRLDAAGLERLRQNRNLRQHLDFWENLASGYRLFEKTKLVPKVTVDKRGAYVFEGAK